MNLQTRNRIKRLFNQQDQYETIKGIAEHAKCGQPILLKTSKTNQILITDVELAKHMLAYILPKLAKVEDDLRKEKL